VIRPALEMLQPQEKPVGKVPGESAECRWGKRDRVSDQDSDDRHYADRQEALDENREGVLLMHQPAIEEGDAWSHQQDQGSAQEDPGGIRGLKVSSVVT